MSTIFTILVIVILGVTAHLMQPWILKHILELILWILIFGLLASFSILRQLISNGVTQEHILINLRKLNKNIKTLGGQNARKSD